MNSPRLSIIQALRRQVGLSRLAEIEEAAVHQRAVPLRLVERVVSADPLTPREREVMVLLASGYTRPEVAAELGIGVETVRKHTSHAYAKLGAHTRVEAVNAFIERAA